MKIHRLISFLILSIIISSCNSVEGMKNKIDKKSNEINELKKYFNKIVPKNYHVRIQYNSSNKVDLFVYKSLEGSAKFKKIFGRWRVNLDILKETAQVECNKKYNTKKKTLELLTSKLNWNIETFNEIYDKLEKIDCIGISNFEQIEIEYGYRGMGLLSFMVFDENLTAAQQEEYSDDCMSMFYKENIVLKYGSGAVGGLCTPEFNRNK